MIVKNCELHQTPHSQHFKKFSFGQLKAPGAKNRQNCTWWAHPSPDQGQKPRKTAPGHNVQ